MLNVGIVGMGYVGLTLSIVAAKAGHNIFGIEKNDSILSSLKDGLPHFYEKGIQESLVNVIDKTLFIDKKFSNDINFDDFADMLAVSGSNNETMRITIIDHEWNVVGDSQVNTNELFNVEKHSPSNRPEIKGALESNYGTDTRTSDTTGEDLIYVAIMRNKNDINS